jgi:hypothetical protein
VTAVWRDWLTDAVLETLGLNEREKQAVIFVKGAGHIGAVFQQCREIFEGVFSPQLTGVDAQWAASSRT